MKKTKLYIIMAGFIILMAGAGWFYSAQSQKTKTPDTSQEDREPVLAVDFNVQNAEGKNTYLSDFYDGKPIVLNFWASPCRPCQLEMPDFMDLYQEYQEDVHFVMIDCIGSLGETKEKGMTFLKENNYTFPVYFDVNQNAVTNYGVMSFPTTYIFNGKQELYAGGTGMIDPDKVRTFLDQLLAE